MAIVLTRRGTQIINDVERSSQPPPFVLKAMERRWAEELVSLGRLRLSSFHYYKNIEDAEIGDPAEGDGRYKVGDDFAEMGHAYTVFLFCAALPTTDPQVLLALQKSYDTLVRVNDVEEFARTVAHAAYEQHGLVLMPHAGNVNYDRNKAAAFEDINRKPWAWNAFQKDPRYAHQCEYRLVFEHYPSYHLDKPKTEKEHLDELSREHVDLQLELKTGILEIVTHR